MHLLGALANAGPSAAHLSATVAPFIVSGDQGVRQQALLALEGMKPSAESDAAINAAKEYDLAASAYHASHGETNLETEIDALLEESESVGFSQKLYGVSYRISGTDDVNLSINGDIHASYANSQVCLSGSGYFKTKVFNGGDKLTEGILAACKKNGEAAKLTFTYKLLNVQLGVQTLYKSSAASEEEALQVARGEQPDFLLGDRETDLQVEAHSTVKGACPVSGSNIPIKSWNKEFFRLNYNYHGLVVITVGVSVGLKGSASINAVLGVSVYCQYAGLNTFGLVAGAAPAGSVTVFASAQVWIFPFKGQVEAQVTLFSGTLPITADITTVHAHGFVKGTASAFSGQVDAHLYRFQCHCWFCSCGRYDKHLGTFNIVKWSGPSKTWTLYSSPTKRFGGAISAASPARVSCSAKSSSSADAGYADSYRGWYDTQGCGQCNSYCRWVGNSGSGGNPASRTSYGASWWSCRRAGTNEAYSPRGTFGNNFNYRKC
jgi:hypothetical protein